MTGSPARCVSIRCSDHECDACSVCLRDRCCRKDNPAYRLPALGSIAPYYGSLGVRSGDGNNIECHICGRWLRSVASHSWAAHDVTVAEYRSAFGLTGRGLIGEDLRSKLSARSRLRAQGRPFVPLAPATKEQRQAALAPLEARIRLRAAIKNNVRLITAQHSPVTVDKIRATKQEKSRAYEEHRICAICGNGYVVQRWQRQVTCSPECRSRHRSLLAKENMVRRIANNNAPLPPPLTAEVKEKLARMARARWAVAPQSARDAARIRLVAHMEQIGPEAAQRQRQEAAKIRAILYAKPHRCTAGCGTVIATKFPRTCSPECRRAVRVATAQATLRRRRDA